MTNAEKYQGENESLKAYRYQMAKEGKTTTLGGYAHWLRQEASGIGPKCCPFCGSGTVVDIAQSSKSSQIGCINCNASGPVCDTKDEAIERWNAVHSEHRKI